MSHETVTSADGTRIAFTAHGEGKPVILVGGAFNDRTTVTGAAEVLADGFTAIAYDRRGRGDSGDAEKYEVEREIEDIAALIAHGGGTASLFGHSSGAILALEATRQGIGVDKLAVYEPPYVVEGESPAPDDLAEQLQALVDAGDRDGAARLFLVQGVGTPAEVVDGMQASQDWPWFTRLAHTLPYDVAICGPGARFPIGRLEEIAVPTLAIGGGTSPDFLRAGAQAVAKAVPGGRYETLAGQDHGVLRQPEALRELLTAFFGQGA